MRKLLAPLFAAIALLTVSYVALPFWTALEIKRALRTGDAATVDARFEWDNVRRTLRESLREQAPEEARRRFGRIPLLNTLAEKVAIKLGRPMADKVVDNYGTASGLIQLMSWRDALRGEKPPRNLIGIAGEMMQRVKKVSFASLTRIEVVVTERNDPGRAMFSAMELRPTGWKVTELRFVKPTD